MKNCSEILFERFLSENDFSFYPIPVGERKTPDYRVTVAEVEVVFEVKEIRAARPWSADKVHRSLVGKHIRQLINGSKGQLQAASRNGRLTVLLIFNGYDPAQIFGTEDFDFEHAMYGEDTFLRDRNTLEIIDRFHGHGKSFQRDKNTSFSALGRLKKERDGHLTVTLFENIYAAVPLDYARLPPCFEVIRFENS
ncbi:MAG: hypothetical protein ACLP7P_19025 [Rhodomicrobium sp.]